MLSRQSWLNLVGIVLLVGVVLEIGILIGRAWGPNAKSDEYLIGQDRGVWANDSGTVFVSWVGGELLVAVGKNDRANNYYQLISLQTMPDGRTRAEVKMSIGALDTTQHYFKRLDNDTMRYWFGGTKDSKLLEAW